MEYFTQALNLIIYFLDCLTSLSLIFVFIICIFVIHLLLHFFRDRNYLKPFKQYNDPESISLADLHDIPLVNIIMPAWNEGEIFRQALISITKLKYPKIRAIINAGGSRETIEIAESFKKFENFTILTQEKGEGKIKAINACLLYVKEGVIYSVDADAYLIDETLIRILYPITNLNEDVSTAGHKPLKFQETKDFVKYLYIDHLYGFKRKFERYGTGGISGTNTIMTLNVINKIGKFTENRLIATDISRGYDILDKGFRVYFSIDYRSLMQAEVPDTFKGFSEQRIRWIENSLQFSSETRNRKAILASLLLFLSSLYLLISPLLIFIHISLTLFGVYILLSKYLKRIRRILFFKQIRPKNTRDKLSIVFYFKVVVYIFLEALINVYILIDYFFLRKKFKKRRNIT